MLKKLEMQENQISEIAEGDFEGLSHNLLTYYFVHFLLAQIVGHTKLSARTAQFHVVTMRII